MDLGPGPHFFLLLCVITGEFVLVKMFDVSPLSSSLKVGELSRDFIAGIRRKG